jgi:hypothetical protein
MDPENTQFHKIWIEQCEATKEIRDEFGLQRALGYLIGEKLFSFVAAAEQHPEFATELPQFLAEIQRLFTSQQVCSYLDNLEHTKFLSPPEAVDDSDLDAEGYEDELLDNPVLGAQEILRFARIKEVLQAEV